MKHDTPMIRSAAALLAGLVLFAAACGDSSGDTSTSDSTASSDGAGSTEALATIPAESLPQGTGDVEASVPVSTPTSEAPDDGPPESVEPLYEAGDIDPGLQPFIDQATTDLADRLDVDEADITPHAAVLVVWPDSSLGCPQPDMFYAQAAVDGSIIELEYDGEIYRYHTGGTEGPFICDEPIEDAPGAVDLKGSGDTDS